LVLKEKGIATLGHPRETDVVFYHTIHLSCQNKGTPRSITTKCGPFSAWGSIWRGSPASQRVANGRGLMNLNWRITLGKRDFD